MITDHQIIIASPPDRERLVAMIDFGDQQWAEVAHEENEFMVEFYPKRDGTAWSFPLEEAIEVLSLAKKKLAARSQ